MTVEQKSDEWGSSFAIAVNGVSFFRDGRRLRSRGFSRYAQYARANRASDKIRGAGEP
jgi:hypothetical protein